MVVKPCREQPQRTLHFRFRLLRVVIENLLAVERGWTTEIMQKSLASKVYVDPLDECRYSTYRSNPSEWPAGTVDRDLPFVPAARRCVFDAPIR
jgi:hypothetical protein